MVMARRREKHSKQENWNVNPWDSYIFIRANIRHRVKTKKKVKQGHLMKLFPNIYFPSHFGGAKQLDSCKSFMMQSHKENNPMSMLGMHHDVKR